MRPPTTSRPCRCCKEDEALVFKEHEMSRILRMETRRAYSAPSGPLDALTFGGKADIAFLGLNVRL